MDKSIEELALEWAKTLDVWINNDSPFANPEPSLEAQETLYQACMQKIREREASNA